MVNDADVLALRVGDKDLEWLRVFVFEMDCVRDKVEEPVTVIEWLVEHERLFDLLDVSEPVSESVKLLLLDVLADPDSDNESLRDIVDEVV